MLSDIYGPQDIKRLSVKELTALADEVRQRILEVVSKNGGHLASSLGVVELTIALHYVFDSPQDRIIWDVGHQCYAHKILTGRNQQFHTLRTFNGISGFPKVSESPHDHYNTGHSSTSLSLALGEAIARDVNNSKYNIVAVIGDGSMTGGMSFEALNHIGHLKKDIIIILNDNEHSISKNVGALSEYLMRLITGGTYNKLRRKSYEFISRIPKIGPKLFTLFDRIEARIKGIFIPSSFFEDLGIRYFGPIDGHNIPMMIEMFNRISKLNKGPKIIHVYTKKGKGYVHAENNPAKFHGIGPFDIKTGKPVKKSSISYSEIAGRTLVDLAKHDKKIFAITAAMKLGTGLAEFEEKFPSRFIDVGICEQHAITLASALAKNGLKPFVSIYSTFMQRAVDQIIHDVALMNLPVKLLIDRAGIVGDDGETHHGLFDIGIIRSIPNFVLLSPTNGNELKDMIYYAASYNNGPVAIRYPRGGDDKYEHSMPKGLLKIPQLKAYYKSQRPMIALFAAGDMLSMAVEIHKKLHSYNIKSSVYSILSIKPLPVKQIEFIMNTIPYYIVLENSYANGGIAEYINSQLDRSMRHKNLFNVAFPDSFITHGKVSELLRYYELDSDTITHKIISMINTEKNSHAKKPLRSISSSK
ncbi:MAG: 1-deoxy-D-xylulose-5-phosphate synthase [Spirochaetota bacterium]|nr:1-deoxy-D-xylulose-5-phosphate synthase [Spirochaetota bacterium]